MIVTTYTCDNCGHSQTTREQMWRWKIQLCSEEPPMYGHSNYPVGEREALWCRGCVEKVGLLASAADKEPEDVKAREPSFEELLRAIVRDELQNSQTGG